MRKHINVAYEGVKEIGKGLLEEYVEKDFGDKHTWTIYFLIDIKIVYIISFAYISIVNFISSTANLEARDDKKAIEMLNITSTKSGYVTEISDAVLWKCRNHSVSNFYYRFLYWMLLVALASTLIGFLVTKMITLINVGVVLAERGFTRMWHIAAFNYYSAKTNLNKNVKKVNEIPINIFDDLKHSCKNICRTIIPFFILFLLVAGITFSLLSYDLHPLACVAGPPDTHIKYYPKENNTGRVEINLTDSLLNFQIAAGIIVVILCMLILILALAFYCISKHIIKDMEKQFPTPSKEMNPQVETN